jgi:Pyruvate/2-oxoacid:ferredoxin oxidoreductase delta subunit
MAEAFPYRKQIEVDKATRPRPPKQLAIIDQTGCTGCEACISFCPVDCIEIVPGPEHYDFHKLVEVDLERCIGCQLCARRRRPPRRVLTWKKRRRTIPSWRPRCVSCCK